MSISTHRGKEKALGQTSAKGLCVIPVLGPEPYLIAAMGVHRRAEVRRCERRETTTARSANGSLILLNPSG